MKNNAKKLKVYAFRVKFGFNNLDWSQKNSIILLEWDEQLDLRYDFLR